MEQRLRAGEAEILAAEIDGAENSGGQQGADHQRERQHQPQGEHEGERGAYLQANLEANREANRLNGELQELERQLAALDQQLLSQEQQLACLGAEADQGWPAGGGEEGITAALQQLLAEKEELLIRRGQNLQLCRSLGATNPQADCEQCQADFDHCHDHSQALTQRAMALRTLVERFSGVRSALADRYGEPMARAIASYLELLDPGATSVQLNFDGSSGFNDLQLRQAQESYAFERLSGGMREQLAAALRLALAEVLAPAYDGSLPLVFDDAFTNSDPERIQGLHQMLERACQSGVQVLLLSCTPNAYGELAERIGSRLDLKAPPRG